jgi:hypothetical protein
VILRGGTGYAYLCQDIRRQFALLEKFDCDGAGYDAQLLCVGYPEQLAVQFLFLLCETHEEVLGREWGRWRGGDWTVRTSLLWRERGGGSTVRHCFRAHGRSGWEDDVDGREVGRGESSSNNNTHRERLDGQDRTLEWVCQDFVVLRM